MSQNRSAAVMQQRAATAPDELDYFPTPPWATRALCQFLSMDLGLELGRKSVWEPACGEMHMARPLAECFCHVRASDVFRYRPEHELADFLMAAAPIEARNSVDLVITNPPFLLAKEFIAAAFRVSRIGFAILVRSSFAEGRDRYQEIFSLAPPTFELVFSERVVMLKGRLIRDGAPDPFNLDEAGQPKKASTATSYVWMLWLKHDLEWGCRKRWIAPCRLKLERDGDYPVYASEILAPPEDGLFGTAAVA
jgi:hypothetical protein